MEPEASLDPAEQMARFRSYLAEAGLKFTRQRKAIADVFFQSGEHLSLQDLLVLAQQREPAIGYATVYRTMKLLADSGLASEHKFAEGQARYEPTHEGEHHDHLICTVCGRIVEFEDDQIERRQDEIARRYGFRVRSHRHVIYGECADCA